MSWTDDRVKQLTKLWADGLSASQIAAELGGVTRNAVIGKVHRLGLSGRVKSPGQSSAVRAKRQPRANNFGSKPQRSTQRALNNTQIKVNGRADRLPEIAVEDLAAPEAMKLALTELTDRTCKWPTGDPATDDFYFCGHSAQESSPYCEYHARLAYQPMADRRRDKRVAAIR